METVNRFQRFRWNWSSTFNDSKAIVSLDEQQTFTTSRDITNQLNRKRVKINETMVQRHFNEAAAKYSRPLSKPLLTENYQMNRLKWAPDHKAMDWNQVIFTHETTIRLNCVKGWLCKSLKKTKVLRTVKHPVKVNF